MTMPPFETELRAALAERAATVPEAASARLRQLDYRPRHRSRVRAASLAATVLAAAAACAVAGAVTIASPHGSASPDAIRLAGFSFPAPAGARVVTTAAAGRRLCAPKPPPAPGVPETVEQAGGVFTVVHGGCLNVNLTPAAVPGNARPVAVGSWKGFIASDQAARSVTLYVDFSARNDLVFTSTRTGLSAAQLIAMARAGLRR